jgi:oligoribonuclease (3'-5' exoribonuclease)
MPRNDLIMFLDLECTGADRDLDDIIEVGLALYSWPEFKEVDSFTSIVTPTEKAYDRMKANAVVTEMHTKNGLLAELDAMLDHDHSVALPGDVDVLIDEWLSNYGTRNSPHIPLAGSGVCHFDRPFVKKSLPLLDARLSYWSYDVGVLRRMFLLAGAKYPADDTKTHRALDDARQHAEEFMFYMGRITQMFGELRAEADAAKE